MEQYRASPAGKHILHRSPQKLGTAAEQDPHGITNHMMSVKLAAVLGPFQHRSIHHGPFQAGQQTPLAAERQEFVHVTILVAFSGVCGLPYCLVWLATRLAGAAHAASGHASSRTTSRTLHVACVLTCVLD
jgi:hypothetical protein